MVHHDVAEHTGFDLDFLRVCFPFYFVACLEFLFRHHSGLFEHPDAVFAEILVEDQWTACLAVESPACCLLLPFIAVSVPVETYRLADLYVFPDDFHDGRQFLLSFCHECVNIFLEVGELFCDCGVQGYHGACAVRLGTDCTEFEAVSRECERRCAVAVCIVDQEFRNLRNAQFHALLASQRQEFVGRTVLHVVEHTAQLRAEEG